MSANCASERDLEARERLIEQQLPLVESLARRYAHRGERLEDLVQVGTIGLIKAVDRYEPGRGVELTAFAVPNILGEIKRHLRDLCGPIRVPRRYQETSARMRTTRRQLTAHLQRNPTAAELAAAANLDEGELAEAMRAEQARTPLSLTDAAPAVSADEIFDASEDRLLISRGLRSLHHQERLVLRYRYFEDLSQEEIAARLGISQTQASRLIASGLAKLRADFEGRSRCVARQKPLHSWHGDSARHRGSAASGDRGKATVAHGEI
ncbi:MAG: sigma-70 family RNA polymerase sigma factor [Gaiellaceae bacterium]